MGWTWRREVSRLTGIDVDALCSETVDIALLDKETDRLGRGAGRMGSIGTTVRIIVRAGALPPIRTQQHPVAAWNSAVPSFPRLDMLDRQHEIFISGRLFR